MCIRDSRASVAPPISETAPRLSNTDDIHAHIAAAHVGTIQKFGFRATRKAVVNAFFGGSRLGEEGSRPLFELEIDPRITVHPLSLIHI